MTDKQAIEIVSKTLTDQPKDKAARRVCDLACKYLRLKGRLPQLGEGYSPNDPPRTFEGKR